MQNVMESVINNRYRGTEITFYPGIKVSVENFGDLEKVSVVGEVDGNEKVLKVILSKKGIFSN